MVLLLFISFSMVVIVVIMSYYIHAITSITIVPATAMPYV